MKIEITINSSKFKSPALRSYNPEEDDIRSILIDICRLVENQVSFNISGFGQDHWPIDSGTDLAVFLEQLPDAISAIREGQHTSIDLYEQGIERYLKISTPDIRGMHQIVCESYTSWKPNPHIEKIHTSELLDMLIIARNTFILIIQKLSPSILDHPWIDDWRRD